MIALLVVLVFLAVAGVALWIVSRMIWEDPDTRPTRLY
jgi:hypothetical protein